VCAGGQCAAVQCGVWTGVSVDANSVLGDLVVGIFEKIELWNVFTDRNRWPKSLSSAQPQTPTAHRTPPELLQLLLQVPWVPEARRGGGHGRGQGGGQGGCGGGGRHRCFGIASAEVGTRMWMWMTPWYCN
jgi:hypothetical protein